MVQSHLEGRTFPTSRLGAPRIFCYEQHMVRAAANLDKARPDVDLLDMTTRWHLSLPLALLALTVSGPACTSFIGQDGDADGSTGTDTSDAPGDGDGDTGTGSDTTIYEIQQGAADGTVNEATIFNLAEVIVTTPLNAEDGLVFVEEPEGGEWSGISLYMWDEAVMATTLQPGDVVNLVGEYAEFFGMSQLVIKNAGDIEVVRSGDPLPGPDIVDASSIARDNAAAEPWEGVRVQIVDAVILEPNDGFGQYVLEGDVLVGNSFVDPLPDVAVMGSFASITGSLLYSFDEFKLQPAMEADLDSYTGPPAPMTDTAIQDIQEGNVPEGSLVLIENVVASTGFTWSDDSEASFFVQEPGGGAFSGIQVHVGNNSGLQIAPGDDVTIVGTYEEFFDMSQISMTDAAGVTVNSSGTAPAAEVIADPASIATGGAATEDWESVLVTVENVTVIDENPDAPDEFGEFVVDGDLRVDDVFFDLNDWTKPMMGASFTSITGVLIYNYENFKLSPRDNADLVN